MNGHDQLRAASRLETAEGLDPWTALMRVLVARLQVMDLPVPLQSALGNAASHIGATGPSSVDLATPEGRTARALLCVLEPAGDEEARSMTAEWFAAMVDDQQVAG